MSDATPLLIERQLQRLDRLAEAGLEVALVIERRAKEAAPEADLDRIALAYARVARAVRQSVLLQSRLVQDLKALETGAAEKIAAAEAEAAEARFEREEERKLRVERIVRRVAKACGGDEDEVDALVAEAGERLDDDGLYAHVMSRPVSEIVADVCKDLGLDPDWPCLAEEAWAKAEIESGDVGRPFAALLRTRPPPLAGEVAQRAGGGIPLPPAGEGVEGACGRTTFLSNAPDG